MKRKLKYKTITYRQQLRFSIVQRETAEKVILSFLLLWLFFSFEQTFV